MFHVLFIVLNVCAPLLVHPCGTYMHIDTHTLVTAQKSTGQKKGDL